MDFFLWQIRPWWALSLIARPTYHKPWQVYCLQHNRASPMFGSLILGLSETWRALALEKQISKSSFTKIHHIVAPSWIQAPTNVFMGALWLYPKSICNYKKLMNEQMTVTSSSSLYLTVILLYSLSIHWIWYAVTFIFYFLYILLLHLNRSHCVVFYVWYYKASCITQCHHMSHLTHRCIIIN